MRDNKLGDDLAMFLDGPLWEIIRSKLEEYSHKMNNDMHIKIRKNNMHDANRCDAKVEAVSELIAIVRKLPNSIKKSGLLLEGIKRKRVVYDD